MDIIQTNYLSADQNWQDETTVVWFDVETDDDLRTGDWGIAFSNEQAVLVDSDGHPHSASESHDYQIIFDALIDQARGKLNEI